MSEFRIVLKQEVGGFSESPEQEVGNATSPALDRPLTIKNGIGIGVAIMYGKRAAGAAFKATVGQMGNAEVEHSMEKFSKLAGYGSKLAGYGAIAYINPALAGGAILTDMFVNTINYAVESHALDLENERVIEARGTRRKFDAGGYYG